MDIPLINSTLVSDAGRTAVASVKDKVSSGEITSLEQLRTEIFTQYITYFQTIGSNPYTPRPYGQYEYKNPDVYNTNQRQIARSLDLLFRESKDLNDALISQFTLMTETSDDLISKVRGVTSNVNALRNQIERRQFFDQGKSVITISDTFTDSTKIDFSKSNVSVDFQTSSVTLNVEGNLNRGTQVKHVEILNVSKDTSSGYYIEDKLPITPKYYEGNRFSSSQGARPEGGNWRINTKNTTVDTANPTLEFDENYTDLSSTLFTGELTEFGGGTSITINDPVGDGERITPDNFIFDDPDSAVALVNWDQPYGSTLTREDLKYVEVAATEEQLEEKRLDMFDGDPRTYWEIEYTPVITALAAELNSKSDADDSQYADYQLISQEYFRDNSDESLEFTMKIELDNVYSMNYIDLTPVFFTDADDANFEITEILTQAGDNETQEGIPNFESYDNIIGRVSNDTITRDNMAQSGTFNKFGFKGKGVWTFKKRKIKYITIKFKQDYAIPNPYVLKNIQLLKNSTYSINESKSKSTMSQNAFSSKNDANSQSAAALEKGRTSRLVQFGYLETISSDIDGNNTALLAGATSNSNANTSTANSTDNSKSQGTGGLGAILAPAITSAALASVGAPVGAGVVSVGPGNAAATSAIALLAGTALDLAFNKSSGGSSSSNTSTSYNDTGFNVNSEYYRTMWTRARYAVGIAEIGMFSRVYSRVGTLTSKPFTVINGSKEVTLTVDERVPPTFLEYEDQTAWIQYFIEINGTAIPINPILGTVRAAGHTDFPSRIVLDREASSDQVTIRFIAKTSRPLESQLLNAESETPILNGYEIKITEL